MDDTAKLCMSFYNVLPLPTARNRSPTNRFERGNADGWLLWEQIILLLMGASMTRILTFVFDVIVRVYRVCTQVGVLCQISITSVTDVYANAFLLIL